MPLEKSGLLTAITTNLKFELLLLLHKEYALHLYARPTRAQSNWNFVVAAAAANIFRLIVTFFPLF